MAFRAGEVPEIPAGDRVRLIIGSDGRSFPVDAILRGTRAEAEVLLCRFQFINPSALATALDPAICSWFNRRQAYRVIPDPATPIEVHWKSGDGEGTGKLLDISASGIAIGVEKDGSGGIDTARPLELTFSLPGGNRPLRVTAEYRRHKNEKNLVRYGLQFDWICTQDRVRQERAVAGFVLRRQKEGMRLG
jgi:c-di-GMP-binding flagellar brake protein YcgR